MVAAHQQFTFADATVASLPGLFFSSRYTTLPLAVTDAAAVGGILVIDQGWTPGTITINCDVMAGGGLLLATSGSTITVTGRVIGESQIFDVTPWLGDPRLTGPTSNRAPLAKFPVVLLNNANVNAAWFGACTAATPANTRKAIQAAFCSIDSNPSAAPGGIPGGTTVTIPAGYTYTFDRNTMHDADMPPVPLPYGILLPEQRIVTVEAEGAVFNYTGSQYVPSPDDGLNRGTCAFAWFSNQPSADFWFAGLEWRGGLASPASVGTNSDFLWLNNQGSRLTVRGLQIGQAATSGTSGHRNGVVQCQWDSSQSISGQRIVVDNCDIANCTDTGVIIVQCDGLMVSGCRIRDNLGTGIELGCGGVRSFNTVAQFGNCSSPHVLSCNFEGNGRSGVKCIDVRDAYVSSDFESNALGRANSDANVDFSGLFDLEPGTGTVTSGSGTIPLSFDPTLRGWAVNMVVKDSNGQITNGPLITALTSSSITVSPAPTVSLPAGTKLSAFLGGGDREGRAECCTWSNSHTSGNALNVITQSSTVLEENLHKGVTAQEIGVLHLSALQPLWCTKEVFTGSTATRFASNSWSGGVITRESAVSCMLPPATSITGSTTVRLTPFFTLDSQSIMVEAGGLAPLAGPSSSYLLQLFTSTGTLVTAVTLTAGTARWEEGPYVSQRVGSRLAHVTKNNVGTFTAGTLYAVYAVNNGATATFDGGVVIRYCPLIPS
jgi:hypothetical protein